jgi:putative solute:sodium symporter small subunit
MKHLGATPTTPSQRHHWRRNLRLTGWLLVVWSMVTFGVAFFARELSFSFFGWPFSFWVGAQGSLLVYVVLIAVYAHQMARLDAAHGLNED